MRWEDQNSFSIITQKDSSGNPLTVNAWKYGVELWCNMEGRYTTIVADFSSLSGQDYSMSICTLSVMGTKYTRRDTVQSTVEIAFKNE